MTMITKRKLSKRWRDNIAGYGFISINLIWVLIFAAWPIYYSFKLSFLEWNPLGTSIFVGLENYREVLDDWVFGTALKNALYYALLTVPGGLIFALGLAIALSKIRGRVVLRVLYFVPAVCSTVAVGVLWRWMYNPDYGLINNLLSHLRIEGPNWLGNPKWAISAISIVVVWAGAGYWMVIFLAGILGIPEVYYDAASIDGAASWQKFRYITLPLITPTIFFYLTMALITVWYQFDFIYVMTAGGPAQSTTMPAYVIYEAAFRDFRMGYACALAWVTFIVAFVMMGLHILLSKKWTFYGK